jgi:hypothetical protein
LESELLAKVRRFAQGETIVNIFDEAGQPVDPDILQPVVGYQQPVGRFHAEVLEQEYKKFFDTNSTSAVKSRATRDKNFRDWLNLNIQKEWVQASSGGVDEHGTPVQARKL